MDFVAQIPESVPVFGTGNRTEIGRQVECARKFKLDPGQTARVRLMSGNVTSAKRVIHSKSWLDQIDFDFLVLERVYQAIEQALE